MNFLADVNIPQSVINQLRKRNHKVIDSKEVLLTASDIQLIQYAKKQKCVILTRDKDFITLTQYPKYQVATIVIRLFDQSPVNIQRYLIELLDNQKESILKNALTIIREEKAESFRF